MSPETQREVLRGLAAILDVLDHCPYVASCGCGWRGSEYISEADAWAELWSTHPAPCHLPRR